MARVTVENGELRVELEGMHKIWALRRHHYRAAGPRPRSECRSQHRR